VHRFRPHGAGQEFAAIVNLLEIDAHRRRGRDAEANFASLDGHHADADAARNDNFLSGTSA